MEQQHLLQRVSPLPIPPFLFESTIYDELAEAPSLEKDTEFKLPSWTYAKKRKSGHHLPQCIAHRGFKAKHPENTMAAFRGAVEVGAHAVETDIHLTKDGVAVLSHDATLKRCFGQDKKIIDCDYEYISQRRTIQLPHEPLPRLQDLLEYLSAPEQAHIWLLLDIKLDNDAATVMRVIALTIASVAPAPTKPWDQRIVLGCWAAKFLPLCAEHLPTYPISHIGFSLSYAQQFLRTPNISFNILQRSLLNPFSGRSFLRSAKRANRPVLCWTVNQENMMRWGIQEGLDGVVTDDPERFLRVEEDWESGGEGRVVRMSWKDLGLTMWINLMVLIFGVIFRWRYPDGKKTGSSSGAGTKSTTPI